MATMTSFFSIMPLLLASYRSTRGSPAVRVADNVWTDIPPINSQALCTTFFYIHTHYPP